MKELKRDVDKLRTQAELQFKAKGVMNARDKVEVDYFALKRLIAFYDACNKTVNSLVKFKDEINNALFGFHVE